MTTLFNWLSYGGQNEDKTLLQHSQSCHRGEFRHVSISARQRSLRCGQNLRGPFLRATLPMTVGSCARTMAYNGKTKGLITPLPRWVSTQSLHVWVSAWRQSRRCSQNLRRSFLQAGMLLYLLYFYYITSGNHTPGSRFHSDLLDTSVCSHCSYSSVVQSTSLRLVPINAHVTWWPHCSIDRAMAAKTKTKFIIIIIMSFTANIDNET